MTDGPTQVPSTDSADGGNEVLEVRGLRAGYEGTVVIHDLDLSLRSGEILAVLGPNGAGKTTLLRVIAGLVRPAAGTVHLYDRDVTRQRPNRRSRLGLCLIPEGRGIYPTLSVAENISLFVERGAEKAATERSIEVFPFLRDKLRQPAGQLSGGQQQMLAVVRSYLADPKIVLVDEVSMGLAPLIVDEIYAFLARIAGEGVSMILVEQFAARALAIADRACVMVQGEIVHSGHPSDLAGGELMSHYLGVGQSIG